MLTSAGEIASGLRIVASVYGATPAHYGDLVLLSGELQAPPRFDQFDYRAFLAEQGIAGIMPSARLVRVTSHPGDPLHTMLFGLRHAVINAVDRALPEPQAALLLGVVFGYRAALPRRLEQQMIASGLIHIVVISGLKVSLLARIVQQAIGRLAPRAAPLLAVSAMIGYGLLAGASAAALRAAAMGVLVVVAGRLRRDSQVFVSLALTGALMLGLKPGLAHDVSFQLSFAGTAGIAAMTVVFARELQRYGVTANAIAPRARTRMTEGTFSVPTAGEGEFDVWAPDNVAPIVAWLATDAAGDVSGQVFVVFGGQVHVMAGWDAAGTLQKDNAGWSVDELAANKGKLFAAHPSGVPPFGFGM